MRLELGKLRMLLQRFRLAYKDQRGVNMTLQKSQAGWDSDRRAKISAHGIDSYPDHEEIGAMVSLNTNKRKARR